MIRKGLEGIAIPEFSRVRLVQFGDNLPEDLINLCTRRTYMIKNIQVGSYTISTWTSESADSNTSPGYRLDTGAYCDYTEVMWILDVAIERTMRRRRIFFHHNSIKI